jgi:hypothetical protein
MTSALYWPKPTSNAAVFVVQTPFSRIIFMSTSGCGERLSALTHAAARSPERTNRPIVFADPQCHVGPFADRDEQRDQPTREEQTAKPVDAARLAYGRFRDDHDRSDGGYRGDDEQDPEEPVVGEVLEDRAGYHDPEPAADSEECRDEGDPAGDALAR